MTNLSRHRSDTYDVIVNSHTSDPSPPTPPPPPPPPLPTSNPPSSVRPQMTLPTLTDEYYEVETPENIRRMKQENSNATKDRLYSKVVEKGSS